MKIDPNEIVGIVGFIITLIGLALTIWVHVAFVIVVVIGFFIEFMFLSFWGMWTFNPWIKRKLDGIK